MKAIHALMTRRHSVLASTFIESYIGFKVSFIVFSVTTKKDHETSVKYHGPKLQDRNSTIINYNIIANNTICSTQVRFIVDLSAQPGGRSCAQM